MSLVHPFPSNPLSISDLAVVFIGLSVGVGAIFEFIKFTVKLRKKDGNTTHTSKNISKSGDFGKVYTITNFWLILSGVIHSWIELSFVYYRSNSFIKKQLDYYASADYRYGDYNGMMESGTTAMEAITALVDGPLCFLVAYGAAHNYSWRHPLQIILCTMQIYGLVWFVLQPMFSETGVAGHFSSDPMLFWVIAVGCNAPWGIFPTILLIQSFLKITESMKNLKYKE